MRLDQDLYSRKQKQKHQEPDKSEVQIETSNTFYEELDYGVE